MWGWLLALLARGLLCPDVGLLVGRDGPCRFHGPGGPLVCEALPEAAAAFPLGGACASHWQVELGLGPGALPGGGCQAP